MPANMVFRYTGATQGAAGTAAGSYGGYLSTTDVAAGLNNLFDNVLPAEASQVGGDVEYRAIDIYNSDSTDAATAITVYIASQTTSTATAIDIAIQDVPSTHHHTASWNGDRLTDEGASNIPSGLSFTRPSAPGTLNFAYDVPASSAIRLWIRRTVDQGAGNMANDTAQIAVQYA